MIKYDLLVYLGLIPLVAVIIFSGFVIWRTPTDTDLETRKIRMADAVLVGLLALFILQFSTSSMPTARVRKSSTKLF
jgi:hypothetical protein